MASPRRAVLTIALSVFVLDRIAKGIVATKMQVGESISLIPHVLDITYVLNNGAAFGVLQHRQPLFIAVALLLLVGVVWVTVRRADIPSRLAWGLGLLAGGAAGNLWDRVVAGQVIDFVHFNYWPVFNFADASIVIGMGLVLYDYWKHDLARDETAGGEPREGSAESSHDDSQRSS